MPQARRTRLPLVLATAAAVVAGIMVSPASLAIASVPQQHRLAARVASGMVKIVNTKASVEQERSRVNGNSPTTRSGLFATDTSNRTAPTALTATPQSTTNRIQTIIGSGLTHCTLLSSGNVVCWGAGGDGELGDGNFYSSGYGGNDTPDYVLGVGGTGVLSGVENVVGAYAGVGNAFCALLTSRGVDCWGQGVDGELGNGSFSSSATPVAVVGIGGTGVLSGVAKVIPGVNGFCALLAAGGVDCWGGDSSGQLGNGSFTSSATPVNVVGVGASGLLAGVKNVATTSIEGPATSCALLTSGVVDCWGRGTDGELGNGQFYTTGNDGSAVPVQVVGVGGSGSLSGVASIYGDIAGFCALGTTGLLNCWGYGAYGATGGGSFSDSATPVTVVGVGGVGQLSGIADVVGSGYSFCAVLTSGGVDCWGNAPAPGNGGFAGSATPVAVVGVNGVGLLTGVASVVGAGKRAYCALLIAGTVDCWGDGAYGELGNGQFYPTGNQGSAVPVQVEGIGATGTLSGVTGLSSAGGFDAGVVPGPSFCAVLTAQSTTQSAACWGSGNHGELGNGTVYTTGSATPVHVVDLGQLSPTGGIPTPQSFYGGPHPFCFPCAVNAFVQGVGSAIHAVFGSPVDTETGNMYDTQTDLALPGRGVPLVVTRTYNSLAAGTDGPFGYGWSTNIGASLQLPTTITTGSTITLVEENGAQTVFTYNGTAWTAPPRVIAKLTENTDGTWKLVRQATQVLTFSSTGQLRSTTDLNGHGLTYHYSGTQLTSISDAAGRSLTIKWTGTQSNANIASVTDTNVTPNRVVTYSYDSAGDLTDVHDVNGGDTHFTYLNHQMTVMSDPKCTATKGCPGIVTHYNASNQVDYQTDQLGRKTMFYYYGDPNSPNGGSTLVVDPKQNETLEIYQFGFKVAETKGYGTTSAATTNYLYDPNTLQATQITDPNGNTTYLTYDANGNLLTKTDPLGRTTSYTYNPLNETATSTDPNGVKTTNTYDGTGNLTKVSNLCSTCANPITQTTSYTVCETTTCSANGTTYLLGDTESMTDPLIKTTKYAYDTYGDLISITDPKGDISTVTYNADGWKLTSVSPRGNVTGCNCASNYTTTYSYLQKATNTIDWFGDVQSVTDPLGHKTSDTYDADRNEVTSTDPLGHTTTYVYDLANEKTQVKRPGGTVLKSDYNLDGTVLDQKNGALKPIETYVYDSLARVTSVTDADGHTTSYTYDPAGNRLSVQQPGGSCAATTPTGCTTYTYDAANEVTSITYSDGTTPNVTNITYDKDGHRTGMSDGTGTWSWTYDALNRLSTITEGTEGTVSYGYNLRGNVTSITYPDGHAITNGYDTAGRWTSTKDWLGNTGTFTYDANSNLVYIKDGTTGVLDHLAFNAADQLWNISDANGTTNVFSATYGRNADGLLTSDSSLPSATKSFAYTPLNQLCYAGSSATSACTTPPSGSQPYAYSAADNLVSNNGATQSFDSADRLCWSVTGPSTKVCGTPPSGATTYSYDPSGNLKSITPPSTSSTPSTALIYDLANRLTTYAQGLVKATYTYNADGLRMSKAITGGATSNYAWDLSGALPLLLSDGTSDYVYGPGGLPLEQVTGTNVLWYHHDQLGSTRALTNSTGASVATYTYDPYGNVTACTGAIVTVSGSNLCTTPTAVANPFTYAGQFRDDESGLYYMRARYYDPATGQFLSVDPLVAVTQSPYGYVAGNPPNGRDPSGLDLCNPAQRANGDIDCEDPYSVALECVDKASCETADTAFQLQLAEDQGYPRGNTCQTDAAAFAAYDSQLRAYDNEVQLQLQNENFGHRLLSGWNTAGNLGFGPGVASGGTPGLGANLGTGVAGVGVAMSRLAALPGYVIGTGGGFLGGFIFGFGHNAEYTMPWHE